MIPKLIQIKNKKHLDELVNNIDYKPGSYLLRIKNIDDLIFSKIKEQNILEYDINLDNQEIKIVGYFNDLSNFINILNYNEVLEIFNNQLKYFNSSFFIKNKEICFNKTYIMGILNVTPDSFSDGGKYFSIENAFDYASEIIEKGIDIIDIGGESTRPNSEPVSEDEEKRRIIPVVEKIVNKYPDTIISIDTTKSSVAEEALKLGASIVNDISGLTFDNKMLQVISKYNAVPVLMHIKGTPKTMQQNPFYENVVSEVYDFLYERNYECKKNGINKTFIDPGIGFGKRFEDNIKLLNNLDNFISIGSPLLLGVSRKSLIGKILNNEIKERDFATSIIETISSLKSAVILRTHNIDNAIQLKKILNTFN